MYRNGWRGSLKKLAWSGLVRFESRLGEVEAGPVYDLLEP